MEIFQIVLPIFLIIGAGFLLRRYGVVTADWVHILNAFVYYIALPAIIAVSFWNIKWLEEGLLSTLGYNSALLLLFAGFLFFALSAVNISRKLKAALFLTVMVGNTVYMGFPIIGTALGQEQFGSVVAVATVHLVLGLVLSVAAVEFWVVRAKNVRVYFLDFIKNPLIVSMAAGVLLSFVKTGSGWFFVLEKPLVMLAATASPVALFALGGFMHGKFMKALARLALLAAGLKLVVLPVFMLLAAAGLFSMGGAGYKISLLSASMPTAVTAFVIAEKYNLDTAFVANAIVLSTALSLITISFWLGAF